MELLKKKTKRNKDNDKLNKNIINEIIYKIEDQCRIKIFGKNFMENNKKNCKIIIENKEQEISEYINVKENLRNLKIKLKEIKTITDMSSMFSNCKSLILLQDIFKWNTNNVTKMGYIFSNCNH